VKTPQRQSMQTTTHKFEKMKTNNTNKLQDCPQPFRQQAALATQNASYLQSTPELNSIREIN